MGSGGCTVGRIFTTILALGFLGAVAYTIWHFVGQPSGSQIRGTFKNFGSLSNINFGSMYKNSDPHVGNNSTELWPTSGTGGLSLEILNALDSTWQKEFQNAVYDWDNGTPDALTLTVKKGTVDPSCTQVGGLQKVCNNNFGKTGWLGINEILQDTSTGFIQSSVAKMNEYYLHSANAAQRQYTMCHEMGHGFGLPHTDENFNNPSMGNCLDYTNKPQEDLHPGKINYKRLASMYGIVGSRRQLRQEKSNSADDAASSSNRWRMLSDDLKLEFEAAIAEIEQHEFRRALTEGSTMETKWILLDYHPSGSSYSRPLGEDLEIQVHMLHPFPAN